MSAVRAMDSFTNYIKGRVTSREQQGFYVEW